MIQFWFKRLIYIQLFFLSLWTSEMSGLLYEKCESSQLRGLMLKS